MCIRAQLTVMTTIAQLRMALRTGNCVNKTQNTTRDPTYARKKKRARMPSIRTTSNNTSTYPQDKRILRGDILHPTSVANEHRKDAAVSCIFAVLARNGGWMRDVSSQDSLVLRLGGRII